MSTFTDESWWKLDFGYIWLKLKFWCTIHFNMHNIHFPPFLSFLSISRSTTALQYDCYIFHCTALGTYIHTLVIPLQMASPHLRCYLPHTPIYIICTVITTSGETFWNPFVKHGLWSKLLNPISALKSPHKHFMDDINFHCQKKSLLHPNQNCGVKY